MVTRSGKAGKEYSQSTGFEYDDDVVLKSIRKLPYCFERIENFLPDTVRLPEFVVPAGLQQTQALVNFALEGLKDKGYIQTKNIQTLNTNYT